LRQQNNFSVEVTLVKASLGKLMLNEVHSKNKNPAFGKRIGIPVLGVKPKRGWDEFWLFFKIDLCSATSMESSRQDRLKNVAKESRYA